MNEFTKTDLGQIKIHQNVIASITAEATKQIPGVLCIACLYGIKSYFYEIIGRKFNENIKIEFDKNNDAIIILPLVVQYGYNIPEIASQVQSNVKQAIEEATNIIVKEINVVVQEIRK